MTAMSVLCIRLQTIFSPEPQPSDITADAMAGSPRHLSLFPLRLLLLLPLLAAGKPVLEDGYTVTTFADLNPLPASGPHPYAVLPRSRAGDLLLLDSAGSALYTISLSSSPGEPRRLAGGKRGSGFNDGGPGDAAFDRPRSVAVDAADNVYVADRLHGAVRKVAPSGERTRASPPPCFFCSPVSWIKG
jgi:hypothetical protein